MEFKCLKCEKIFYPHRFIAFRHPGNAKCPECNGRGKLTERGIEMREERFLAMNQSNYKR